MRKGVMFALLLCVIGLFAQPVFGVGDVALREALIESVSTGDDLNIAEYGLHLQDLEDIYFDLYCRGLLPWYADSRFNWVEDPDGLVSVFVPRGIKEQRFDEAAYERAMAQMLHETCYRGMEPWKKALSIHDYIVTHCVYDETAIRNTGYQALVHGESACFGYAQLYMDAMNRVGVPCQIVVCNDTGDGVGHAWNVVRLGGKWFHVDVTWDDGSPDIYGRVSHDHFLKTDEQFRSEKNGHNFDWESNVKCDGSYYCYGWFWEDYESPVIFLDKDTFALRRLEDQYNVIYRADADSGALEELHSFAAEVTQDDGQWYIYHGYGFMLWNGRFYFNSERKVFSMLPDGTDVRTVYGCEDVPKDIIINSCAVDEGKLYLTLVDRQNQFSTMEVELANTEYHVHQYVETKIDATCLEEGFTKAVCECGIDYRYGRQAAAGHRLEERSMPDGSVQGICRECDYVCVLQEAAPTAPSQDTITPSGGEKRPVSMRWIWVGLGVALMGGATLVLVRGLRRKKHGSVWSD